MRYSGHSKDLYAEAFGRRPGFGGCPWPDREAKEVSDEL
jgi:hypothetical protein